MDPFLVMLLKYDAVVSFCNAYKINVRSYSWHSLCFLQISWLTAFWFQMCYFLWRERKWFQKLAISQKIFRQSLDYFCYLGVVQHTKGYFSWFFVLLIDSLSAIKMCSFFVDSSWNYIPMKTGPPVLKIDIVMASFVQCLEMAIWMVIFVLYSGGYFVF